MKIITLVTILCLCLCMAAHPAKAAALTLLTTQPEGTVPLLTQVTVRFSEDMRPLGAMEQEAASSPLRLNYPNGTLPKGKFRWLDPATLAYFFDAPVQGPAYIEAYVPASTTALSGAQLAAEKRWQITTPAVKFSVIEETTSLPPQGAAFTLMSNHDLTLKDIQARAHLTLDEAPLPFTIEKQVKTEDPFGRKIKLSRESAATSYIVRILAPLPPNKAVKFSLDAGIRPIQGNVAAAAASFSLHTWKPLQVTNWYTAKARSKDTQTELANPQGWISLAFSNPVSHKAVLQQFSFSPPLPQSQQQTNPHPADKLNEEDDYTSTAHRIAYTLAPRTKYTVTVKPGLKDTYESTLAQAASYTFTTGDLSPYLNLPRSGILKNNTDGKLHVASRNMQSCEVSLSFVPYAAVEKFLSSPENGTGTELTANFYDTEVLDSLKSREVKLHLNVSDKPNEELQHILDLPKLLGDIRNGYILVRTVSLSSLNETEKDTFHYQISNIGLTVAWGPHSGVVRAADLTTDKPMANTVVRLCDSGKGELWRGTTNADGLAFIKTQGQLKTNNLIVFAAHNNDVVASLMRDSHNSNEASNYLEGNTWDGAFISQMPLYQPGQKVRFSLYLREFSDMKGEVQQEYGSWRILPQGEKITLRLLTPDWQEVYKVEGTLNEYGSFAGSFDLPAEARFGEYHAEITRTLPPAKNAARNEEARIVQIATTAFTVAAFRPPDILVNVSKPTDQPLPIADEEPLTAQIESKYFTGIPLAKSLAKLTYAGAPTSFSPNRLNGYTVGQANPNLRYHKMSALDEPKFELQPFSFSAEQELDEQGATLVTLEYLKSLILERPCMVTLTASVSDAAGLENHGSAGFILHPSAYYVGIKTPYAASVGKPLPIQILGATFNDDIITNTIVELKAERIIFTSTPHPQNTGRRSSNQFPEQQTELAWQAQPQLTATGNSLTFTPTKGGTYRITARIRDNKGRKNTTESIVYVAGAGWGSPLLSEQTGTELNFFADKKEYAPGDTARLILTSPALQADSSFTALITTERQGVRQARLETVTGPSPVIEIPITQDDAPYLFVSVSLTRGEKTTENADPASATSDTAPPTVLWGNHLLLIPLTPPESTVAVYTDASVYKPGDTVSVKVSSLGDQGKGKKAEITLLAIDERILFASGKDSPYDPAGQFPPHYSYGVTTADTRKQLAFYGKPSDFNARMMSPMMAKTASDTSTEADSSALTLRENFQPDVLWLAQAVTDDKGELNYKFTLPDSLTRYRIVAIAADAEGGFTTGQTKIVATKPLQIQSALPRFATVGDKLEARVSVQNLTSKDGNVTISLQTKSPEHLLSLADAKPQTFFLKASETKVISFPLHILGAEAEKSAATLLFSANLQLSDRQESDAVAFQLPIKPAASLITVAASGVLKNGEHRALPIQPSLPLDPRSRLDVIVAPSPAAGLPLAAQSILDYPWNCLEQRLSRAWVRMLRLDYGALLGLPPSADDKEKIAEMWRSLPNYQQLDGGFSLWADVHASDPYLTAYVFLFSVEAKKLGFYLSPEIFSKAAQYLWEAMADESINPETSAFILLALSQKLENPSSPYLQMRKAPLLPHWQKPEQTYNGSPFGLAALMLARHAMENEKALSKTSDSNTAQAASGTLVETLPSLARLISILEKTAVITPTQLHFATVKPDWYWMNMGSTLRDNAMLLWAFSKTKPNYPRLDALAFWVSQNLGETTNLSTQEGIYGLIGLSAYLENLKMAEGTSIAARWNSKKIEKTFTRLIDAPHTWSLTASDIAAEPTESMLEFKALQGNPYWTARLVYAAQNQSAPSVNAGLSLTRTFSKLGPYRMGEEVQETLVLTVPATRRHVLLFNPFPAGLEPQYASRADLQQEALNQSSPWLRKEMHDDGLLLYTSTLQPGTYVFTYTLKAATPGSFIQRQGYAEEIYTPETFGKTEGNTVTILP